MAFSPISYLLSYNVPPISYLLSPLSALRAS
jgi:hypothetical protein